MEIIDAARRFAPLEDNMFESGQTVAPGVYVDESDGMMVTMKEEDVLPTEVRMVETRRRFRRFESRSEACSYLEQLSRAA